MLDTQHKRDVYLSCMLTIFVYIFGFFTDVRAQSQYRPLLKIAPAQTTPVTFNYGLGVFTCQIFNIQTIKTATAETLLVQIFCTDNPNNDTAKPTKKIEINYRGIWNIGTWNSKSFPYPAVLECRGSCTPQFSTLTIGNLPAKVTIIKPNCPTCTIVKNFGGVSNVQAFEVQIINQDNLSAVFFRIGNWKLYSGAGMFKDDIDPGAPRASRYAGGAALPKGDLKVTSN